MTAKQLVLVCLIGIDILGGVGRVDSRNNVIAVCVIEVVVFHRDRDVLRDLAQVRLNKNRIARQIAVAPEFFHLIDRHVAGIGENRIRLCLILILIDDFKVEIRRVHEHPIVNRVVLAQTV